MKKYFLSLTMFLLLFLLLPTSVEAIENEKSDGETNKFHAVSVDGDTKGYDFYDTCTKDEFTGLLSKRKSRSTASTSETGLFGSQLSGETLEIYEGLSSVEIGSVHNGISMTLPLTPEDDAQTVFNTYDELYPAALFAYARDRHDLFYVWWFVNKIGIRGSYNSTRITLTFYYEVSPYYTDEMQAEADERIDTLVQACTGYNRKTKLKYYHDWIVENNYYDTPTSQIELDDDPDAVYPEEVYFAHTAVGCLLKGKGVCESYSKLLKLFCLRENIPCLLITSDTHAWNYVKMEDGNWYMVDCTWDDPVGGSDIYYTYFLVSNEPNIDDSHTVDSRFIYPATSSVPYPSAHDFRLTNRVEATCILEGSETYYCSHCGESVTFTIPVDPSNHTGDTVIKDRVEATCGIKGYTGDTYCKDCGELLEEGETIPATGQHVYPGEGTVTKPATCVAKGEMTYTCEKCGTTKVEEIPINPSNHTGNTILKDQKEATCEEDGYTGDTYCKDCGELLEEGEAIPATGHMYPEVGEITKPATCVATGEMTYTCENCGTAKVEEIPIDPSNHTGNTILRDQKEATCEEDGYTGDTYCKDCGELLEEGETIPATGQHVYPEEGTVTKPATCIATGEMTYTCENCGTAKVEEIPIDPSNHTGETILKNQKEATCEEEGYTGDTYCKDCDVLLSKGETIPATGQHVYPEEGTVTKPATCVAKGEMIYVCENCGAAKVEEIPINPSNHTGNTIVKDQKEATCEEEGYTGDTYCKDCGELLEEGETIPATGQHVYPGEGIVTKPATCMAKGEMTYTCENCGTTKVEEIPIDPSNHIGGTQIRDAREATLGQAGYTGDTYCNSCNSLSRKGEVIPKKQPVTAPATVTNITVTNSSNGMLISWTKANYAEGYYIYRKVGSGSYQLIAKIDKADVVSFTDTAVNNQYGSLISYAVCAYNGNLQSSIIPTSNLRLTGVPILSLKNRSAKTMKVKWEKSKQATGYQLQYALNNKFTKKAKTLRIKKAGTLSKTIKKLKKGKKYFVRIRTYRIYGNATYYSAWSKTKKIKIKKIP